MGSIIAYATDKDGDGHVMKIGEYDDMDEIVLRVGHFGEDVVITFTENTEEQIEARRKRDLEDQ